MDVQGILVHLGHYNKDTRDWVALFITVLKPGKSKIKLPADSEPGKNLLPSSEKAIFLLCPHMVERGLLYKDTNPHS